MCETVTAERFVMQGVPLQGEPQIYGEIAHSDEMLIAWQPGDFIYDAIGDRYDFAILFTRGVEQWIGFRLHAAIHGLLDKVIFGSTKTLWLEMGKHSPDHPKTLVRVAIAGDMGDAVFFQVAESEGRLLAADTWRCWLVQGRQLFEWALNPSGNDLRPQFTGWLHLKHHPVAAHYHSQEQGLFTQSYKGTLLFIDERKQAHLCTLPRRLLGVFYHPPYFVAISKAYELVYSANPLRGWHTLPLNNLASHLELHHSHRYPVLVSAFAKDDDNVLAHFIQHGRGIIVHFSQGEMQIVLESSALIRIVPRNGLFHLFALSPYALPSSTKHLVYEPSSNHLMTPAFKHKRSGLGGLSDGMASHNQRGICL